MDYIRTDFMIRDVCKLLFSYINLLVGTSLFMTYNIVYLSIIPFFVYNHFLLMFDNMLLL